MLLPAILHGPYPKVKKELRARLRELAKGATFSECLRLDDTVDSEASMDETATTASAVLCIRGRSASVTETVSRELPPT